MDVIYKRIVTFFYAFNAIVVKVDGLRPYLTAPDLTRQAQTLLNSPQTLLNGPQTLLNGPRLYNCKDEAESNIDMTDDNFRICIKTYIHLST